jgi:hypothetical protein
MASDREKILAEIERLIEQNAANHPTTSPEYGSNKIEIEGVAIWQVLNYLQDFIAALPAAENPRVGDRFVDDLNIPNFEVTAISGNFVIHRFLHGTTMSIEQELPSSERRRRTQNETSFYYK